MNNQQKRLVLFLFGCIFVRSLFVVIAKTIPSHYLPFLGALALLPAIGFFTIYFTNSRKTGAEVFGERIWWNSLRPVHGFLYLVFAYLAITKQQSLAWKVLLADVVMGLSAFIAFRAGYIYNQVQ